MKIRTKLIALVMAALCACNFTATLHAAGKYVKVDYPASTVPGEMILSVTYTLWIPDGVKTFRGIIVHQHGAGMTASKEGSTAAYDLHWQALAKKWDCALLGPCYHVLNDGDMGAAGSEFWFDPRRGSAKTFLKALDDFAAKTGHPELAKVPWALWGHSAGAGWADLMATLYPERIVGVYYRSGCVLVWTGPSHSEYPAVPIPANCYGVPRMCTGGATETWLPPLYKTTFMEYRTNGGPIGCAFEPRSGHECRNSRYFAIPFLDACLAMRLPDKWSKDQTLKPVDMSQAWLVAPGGDTPVPAADYKGKVEEAWWLPNELVAKDWVEYTKTGEVSDTTPPPTPFDVQVTDKAEQGMEVTWSADADFESGIRQFIILRDGTEFATVPETPKSQYGARPLFQSETFHDTPSQPMPRMAYMDATAKAADKHTYSIIEVNSVGLKSKPSASAPSPYLRIDMSTTYQVDPSWPEKRKDIVMGPGSGLAVDGQDNVWVLSRSVPFVQVYQADGKFVQAWGDEKLIRGPHMLALDSQGHVWITDTAQHVVLECSPDGKLLRTLGTPGVSGCDESHFFKPTDVVVTPAGDVFISDGYGNARVVQYDKDGKFVKSWGKLGLAPGDFNLPHAITVDSHGRIYVADRNNSRIQVFDHDGAFLDQWRNVVVPCAFWMTKDDELWVVGTSPMNWRPEDDVMGYPPKDQLLMKFNTAGKLLQLWSVPLGQEGKYQPGDLDWAHCLAVDSKGNIYVGDVKGKRVQKFVAIPGGQTAQNMAGSGQYQMVKLERPPDRPGGYKFDRTISRQVLENYLSRSITMEGLLNGRGDLQDNIRMLTGIGAKYIGRALCLWGAEANFVTNIERARAAIPQVLAADPDMVLEACVFETVSDRVNQIAIPDWVFTALGQPVEKRNFRYDDMIYPQGQRRPMGRGQVPDESRMETQLWFYYQAASYIDIGCEGIHFGQVEIMNKNDLDNAHWEHLLTLVRAYAAQHARRHMVLCNGHVPSGGLIRNGNPLLDFHAFPLRILETPDKPKEAILKLGFSDGIYGHSGGGMTFSGWTCEHLPYLVEFDNYGVSQHPGQPNVAGPFDWIWGYDEITWFAHQTKQYRANWLQYAWDWVRKTDPCAFLEMPGSRTATSPDSRWYFANNPSPAVPTGYGDEDAIRAVWAGNSAK